MRNLPRGIIKSARAPERQSARAPERQSARAPERQSARAPERMTAPSRPVAAPGASSGGSSPPSAPCACRRPSRRPPERHPAGDGRRPSPPPSRFSATRFAARLARGRAGACALAAALALLLGAGAAEAQTASKLVGNTSVTGSFISKGFHQDRATSFTTGSNDAGYTATRVDLSLRSSASTQPTYSVGIHSDSSGLPGTRLGTLSTTASLSSVIQTIQFTSSAGINLAADTTYWVVLDVSAGTSESTITTKWSTNEDTDGAAGWSLGDAHYLRNRDDSGTWATESTARPFFFRIYGKSLVSPEFSSAWFDDSAIPYRVGVNFIGPISGCASRAAWDIKVDGSFLHPAFYKVRCEGRSVVLYMRHPPANEVPLANHVTVSYDKRWATWRGGSKLTGADGGEVASFSDRPVTGALGDGAPRRDGGRQDDDAHLRASAQGGLRAGGQRLHGGRGARRRAGHSQMLGRLPGPGVGQGVDLRRHGDADPGGGGPQGRNGDLRLPATRHQSAPARFGRSGAQLQRKARDRRDDDRAAALPPTPRWSISGTRCGWYSTRRWTEVRNRRRAPSR